MCRVCKDLLGQAAATASGGPKLPAPAQLMATVIAECKKRDKEYKLQAIVTLSSLLTLFPDIDVYTQVRSPTPALPPHPPSLVLTACAVRAVRVCGACRARVCGVCHQVKEEIQDIAAGEIEEDEDEEASKGKEREEETSGEGGSGEESRKRKAIREKLRIAAVTALGNAFPSASAPAAQRAHLEAHARFLVAHARTSVAVVQVPLLHALTRCVRVLAAPAKPAAATTTGDDDAASAAMEVEGEESTGVSLSPALVRDILDLCWLITGDTKFPSVRQAALELVREVVTKCKHSTPFRSTLARVSCRACVVSWLTVCAVRWGKQMRSCWTRSWWPRSRPSWNARERTRRS